MALCGPVILSNSAEIRARFDLTEAAAPADLAAVTRLDTAGAWLLVSSGRPILNATDAQAQLLATVRDALPPDVKAPHQKVHHQTTGPLVSVGMAVGARFAAVAQGLGFMGIVVARLAGLLVRPWRLRFTAVIHHMEQVGLNAVPIVALMGFLIGVVLAFQGAAQLRQFGAEVFVVDLIAVSILRELGVLLTAIIVAGRSASAFTAAIGSMKMREEIDAIRVLGLDPIELLVLPRLLALVIVLPILGFVADVSGLFGGGLMVWTELGISPSQFRTRLLADVGVAQVLVGLSKTPVFAAIIALVGCYHGLQVKGDAESLGMRTSRSVVTAIFLVIVTDSLFSVFFAVWGV